MEIRMILSNVQKEGLIKTLKEAAFALETVAHLQGREATMLPFASACRKWQRELMGNKRDVRVGHASTRSV
jgi:hypothetical protein